MNEVQKADYERARCYEHFRGLLKRTKRLRLTTKNQFDDNTHHQEIITKEITNEK